MAVGMRLGKMGLVSVVVGWLATGAALPQAALGQEEEELKNLQYFPHDISRDSLIQVMRGFSFALGVRCQYCHTGGDGVSFEGVVFESDDDPDKRKARYMLRLVETLNRSMLPMMADRDEPGYQVTCKTCHRGRPKPELLTDRLRATLDTDGPDEAVAVYSALREQALTRGMYDFGEWEMNVLAERLTAEGRHEDAIAIYRINEEYFPNSISIVLALGALHEQTGETEAAIGYYERALEISPDNANARARLEALGGR